MREQELARELRAWEVPGPSPEETEALVALVQALPRPGAFRTRLERERGARPPGRGSPLTILQLTLAQAGFFRPWFWLASLVTVAGGLVFLRLTEASAAVTLATVVPVLTALGVAHAFRAVDTGAWEVELSCPISPAQLALGRLVVVVAYDLVLGVAASLAVWWGEPPLLLTSLILSWLTPLLLTASLALYLCLSLNAAAGGTLAAGFWLAQVLARRAGVGMALFAGPGEPGWGFLQGAGLAAAALLTLLALRTAASGRVRARAGAINGG